MAGRENAGKTPRGSGHAGCSTARSMRALAFVLLGAAVAATACGDEPKAPTATPASVELCQRPKSIDTEFHQGDKVAAKTLVLTFDDGPAEVTSELSTYLKSEGIAATFFVNGANFAGFETALEQVVADGHLVGNHTQTHAALTSLASVDVVREVAETDALIKALVPEGKLFFRPPFGDYNPDVQKALAGSAMNKYQGPIGWDIGDHMGPDSAADWDCWSNENGTTSTVEECGSLYLKEIRQKTKGIVLLHDGPPGGDGAKTLAMVKQMVPVLKKEGYSFARVDAPLPTGTGAGSAAPGEDPCAKK
jgi:peptidoglycan-N-acetylglucosamine deacetylase